MEIFIRNGSGQPIYEQICVQIRGQILSGGLRAGDALPSIRTLAKDLRISVITTKRAYDELEREGLIHTVAGKGCFVAEADAARLREEKLMEIEKCLRMAAALAKDAGVTGEETAEMLRGIMEEMA